MANKRITELPTASSLDGSELYEIVQGGVNKKVTQSISNQFRGDWSGTALFPSTGGTYLGGVPGAGNRWRLTNTLTIGVDVYSPGTIIEAAVNIPGQTTGNWIKYSTQI